MIRLLAFAAVLLVAVSASAGEKDRPWSVGVGASYLVLGDERPTGGLMPSLSGGYTWRLGETVGVRLGISAGVVGLGSDVEWMGVLAGPCGGVDVSLPVDGLSAGAAASADLGRVPVCNGWGLCLQYVGLYPRGEFHAAYELGGGASIEAAIAGRYVTTLGWTGASWEPRLSARVAW